MRMNTKKLLEQAWNLLLSKDHLNGFESREAFEAEFMTLGEVVGDGRSSFFSRISARKRFEQGNIQIVNIEHPLDEEKILVPFIGVRAG